MTNWLGISQRKAEKKQKQPYSPKRKSAYRFQIAKNIFVTEEAYEHFKVAEWLRLHNIFFIHVPSESKRSKLERTILKALGAINGISDILIFDVPENFPYRGIAIEMKTKKGRVTDNQKEFLINLECRNWLCKVCFGADQAITWLEGFYGKERRFP